MRGQPERILVVIPSPVLGGAEAQTLQVARGLRAMGAEVALAAEPAVLRAADGGCSRHRRAVSAEWVARVMHWAPHACSACCPPLHLTC